jgi:hypothetical protein
VPVYEAFSLKDLDRHKLHSAGPVARSAWQTVQLLRQVQVNQHAFRVSLSGSFRNNDIVFGNVPMKNPPVLKKRFVTPDSITQRL